MPTVGRPNILTDPGYLFWAPLGTSEPVNTVAGSKFTDPWTAPWIPLGATSDGTKFEYSTKVQAISVAEFLDPIQYATTERSGAMAFSLADWTLSNWRRALNGAPITLVSGTGPTQLNKLEPTAPGTETRSMLGWESIGSDVRLIVRQGLNGGNVTSAFQKAPNFAVIPCNFEFEVPANGATPFAIYTAGTARA